MLDKAGKRWYNSFNRLLKKLKKGNNGEIWIVWLYRETHYLPSF